MLEVRSLSCADPFGYFLVQNLTPLWGFTHHSIEKNLHLNSSSSTQPDVGSWVFYVLNVEIEAARTVSYGVAMFSFSVMGMLKEVIHGTCRIFINHNYHLRRSFYVSISSIFLCVFVH